MSFSRIWHAVRGGRRPPSSVQVFRQAQRFRDEGRFEEAAALIASGLLLDRDNVVGLLLAGSLHAMLREMAKARSSFERVLALDPTHPRALLGLARITLEEGDTDACVELLRRALARYPDFPEASALLEVAQGLPGRDTAKRAPASVTIRADRLRLPPDARETLLTRTDAMLLFALPRSGRSTEIAVRAAKLCRIASAMLARAGLGGLHHAVNDGAAETTYLRADGDVILTLGFARGVKTASARGHVERVWAACRAELGRLVS
jgi:tetratricopeptide (TPR) repeat protein